MSGRYNILVTTKGGTNLTSSAFDVLIDKTALTPEVITRSGISVTVPAGAFSANVAVVITDLSAAELAASGVSDKKYYQNFKFLPALGSEYRKVFLSKTVTIDPAKTITLSMSYAGKNVSPWLEPALRLLTLDETTSTWELAGSNQTVDSTAKVVNLPVEHFSIFRLAQWVSAAADLSNVVIYPNPIDFGTAVNNSIKFSNLTLDPTIYIYTLSGEPINTIEPRTADNDGISGTAVWNGNNTTGSVIVRGLYFYLVKDAAGGKKTGKFVVK